MSLGYPSVTSASRAKRLVSPLADAAFLLGPGLPIGAALAFSAVHEAGTVARRACRRLARSAALAAEYGPGPVACVTWGESRAVAYRALVAGLERGLRGKIVCRLVVDPALVAPLVLAGLLTAPIAGAASFEAHSGAFAAKWRKCLADGRDLRRLEVVQPSGRHPGPSAGNAPD